MCDFKVLTVDRADCSWRNMFEGEDWFILGQDENSFSISEFSLQDIKFETGVESGERLITLEEKLGRLKRKEKYVFLDIQVLYALLNSQDIIPDDWRRHKTILFGGTVISVFLKYIKICGMYWDGEEWGLCHSGIKSDMHSDNPFALLELN